MQSILAGADMPVYINTYSATKALLIAALKKVFGESEFQGKSPVDLVL